MSSEYKDRFTEAEKELAEKSAFICESCNKEYGRKDAEDVRMACCGKTLRELKKEAQKS
jgi:hypothetical protein